MRNWLNKIFFGEKKEIEAISQEISNDFVGGMLKSLDDAEKLYRNQEYISPIYKKELLLNCPYCKKENSKIFKRQRKCEHCKKTVYLRMGEDMIKRLYTEEQVQKMHQEEEIEKYNKILLSRQCKGKTLEEIIQSFENKIQGYARPREKERLISLLDDYVYVLKYNKQRERAYIFYILDFLLSSIDGFFFYLAKMEADNIKEKYGKKSREQKAKKEFEKLAEKMEFPKELIGMKRFIKRKEKELREYEFNSNAGEKYLRKINKIHRDYILKYI